MKKDFKISTVFGGFVCIIPSCSKVEETSQYCRDDISELIMFCKHLQSYTTGEEIFNVIDLFFSEHNLSWNF